MTRVITTETVLVSLLFCLLCIGNLSAAQEPQRQEHCQISGQLTDENGKSLAGARIALAAGFDVGHNWFADFNPDRRMVEVQADDKGHFTLQFDRDDPAFLVRGPLALIADAKGYQFSAIPVTMPRILSDAPLDIQLRPEEEVALIVLDALKKPIVGATVAVAATQSERMPFCYMNGTARQMTDADGVVRLKQTSSKTLSAVFVTHATIGNQRIPVRPRKDGQLVAIASRSRPVVGTIESPGMPSIPGLAATKLFVVSVPISKYQHPITPLEGGWSIVPVEKDGTFEIANLQLGDLLHLIDCPKDFPYREQFVGTAALTQGPAAFKWKITFREQPKASVTVLDDEGTPLPNIHVSCVDRRLTPTVTDKNGKASFFSAIPQPRHQAVDAFGEYFNSRSPNTVSARAKNSIEYEPIRMARRTKWTGRVIDGPGQPVPAAKVAYKFGVGRLAATSYTYSDVDGSFRLYNVTDGTDVELSASKDQRVSESTKLVLPNSNGLELRLKSTATANLVGQLLDNEGQPVVDVDVSIGRLSLLKAESFGRATRNATNIYGTKVARTDNQGRFRFPPTEYYRSPVRIIVNDPNYYPFRSPFRLRQDAPPDKATGSAVDLGQFRLKRKREPRTVVFQVTSSAGAALSDATVVCVGARARKTIGRTDTRGKLSTRVDLEPCLVAVHAEGHRLYLGKLAAASSGLEVTLRPKSEKTSKKVSPTHDADSRSDIARSVISKMDVPDVDDSSFYRLRLYAEALATVAPKKLTDYLRRHAKNETVREIAKSFAVRLAIQQRPELVETIAADRLVDPEALSGFYLTAANWTSEKDIRREWLGEAVALATDRFAKAECVRALLCAGEEKSARRLASELLMDCADLRSIESFDDVSQQALRDVYALAPIVAIVNLNESRKLVQLAGSKEQIDALQTLSWLNWRLSKRGAPVRQVPALNANGVETWLRQMSPYSGMGFADLPSPLRISEQISGPVTRLTFLLFQAESTRDKVLRKRIAQRIIAAVENTDSSDGIDLLHGQVAALAEAIPLAQILESDELDRLIFHAIRSLPTSFVGSRSHNTLAQGARLVALRDPALGQLLLEPSFQDRGWMFGIDARDRDAAIACASWIDPHWCSELVEELNAGDFKHHPTDQEELRAVVIRSLMQRRR